MERIKEIVNEYKKARQSRNAASFRNDFGSVKMFNDELTYWSQKLTEAMEVERIDIQVVREMLK